MLISYCYFYWVSNLGFGEYYHMDGTKYIGGLNWKCIYYKINQTNL